jgi:hypothetical protein
MLQSIIITAEDILKHIKLSLKTSELKEEIITREIILDAAKEAGITVGVWVGP